MREQEQDTPIVPVSLPAALDGRGAVLEQEQEQEQDQGKTENGQPQEPKLKQESSMRTTSKFVYLLNAMEQAAQEEHPADHDYGAKRKRLLAYVDRLEDRAEDPAAELDTKRLDWLETAVRNAHRRVVAIESPAHDHVTMWEPMDGEVPDGWCLARSAASVRAALDLARTQHPDAVAVDPSWSTPERTAP